MRQRSRWTTERTRYNMTTGQRMISYFTVALFALMASSLAAAAAGRRGRGLIALCRYCYNRQQQQQSTSKNLRRAATSNKLLRMAAEEAKVARGNSELARNGLIKENNYTSMMNNLYPVIQLMMSLIN